MVVLDSHNKSGRNYIMSTTSKKIAVIGAGISGVVAAAHLKLEGQEVVVFERSSAAGGVWYGPWMSTAW